MSVDSKDNFPEDDYSKCYSKTSDGQTLKLHPTVRMVFFSSDASNQNLDIDVQVISTWPIST